MERPIFVTEHDGKGASFVYVDEKHANATLWIDDGRHISRDQQRKAYALLGEIDDWCGNYILALTKAQMKRHFLSSEHNNYVKPFSLGDCSMTQARDFIDFLISFCFANRVPFDSYVLDLIQGSYGWELYALENKQCCICRNLAEVAHVHAVGIGRDRQHISHVGNSVMALCHKHHMEQHRIGINNFMNKYHLKGVKVTQELAEMLKLGDWHIERGQDIISTRGDSVG